MGRRHDKHPLAHDHGEMDSALAAVFTALADGDVEQTFHSLDVFWARLAVHIRAENVHLFPSLLRASQAREIIGDAPAQDHIADTIEQLRADHDFFMIELTAAMKELREFRRENRTDSAKVVLAKVQQRLQSVSRRLDSHNTLEESQTYHWSDKLLNEQERKVLNESIQTELERLPPRLRTH